MIKKPSNGHAPEPISDEPPGIVTTETLATYFAQEVSAAVAETNVQLTADAEFYLVTILDNFLFKTSSLKELMEQPLALVYGEALNAPPTRQIKLYRKLGDGALYISGFFADSLNHSLVDVDYYMAMGERAYGNLAALFGLKAGGHPNAQLYDELACKFGGLVNVLNAVSERSTAAEAQRDSTSLLRLYERWQRTKSQRLQRALHQRGVFPGADGSKDN